MNSVIKNQSSRVREFSYTGVIFKRSNISQLRSFPLATQAGVTIGAERISANLQILLTVMLMVTRDTLVLILPRCRVKRGMIA
jgi:hypothetical protein